jgi:hypothetical protein
MEESRRYMILDWGGDDEAKRRPLRVRHGSLKPNSTGAKYPSWCFSFVAEGTADSKQELLGQFSLPGVREQLVQESMGIGRLCYPLENVEQHMHCNVTVKDKGIPWTLSPAAFVV